MAIVLAALAIPGAASGGTVFLLDGRGWGHGVGMSQWGAEGYARQGYAYRSILAHYYPHTHIGLAGPREVRVLLKRNAARLRIGSAAPFVVIDARGRTSHLGARTFVVRRGFRRLAFPLRFRPGAQPLRFGGSGYRGDIVVKQPSGGLLAVNVLPLDRYLRGVVPWEVPVAWHTATYEAQAVAARSYTLATLKPGKDFDLYPDQRSQMYGGIAAERTSTNLAIGATAGQVLVWRDRIIPAFYFSTSGGRTSSVHDAWPRAHQVPYLVSVSDPYDRISPHHVWPTSVLTPARVGSVLHVRDVQDMQVVDNSSGRAASVRVLGARGWRTFPGQVIRTKFHLGSTDFQIHALTLDDVPRPSLFGAHVAVQGWVRGLGRARLQELTDQGWKTVRSIHTSPNGHFRVSIAALRSTQLRLAYNSVAGSTVPLRVAPRVSLTATGAQLRVLVAPRLPLQVQRLTHNRWRRVASARGTYAGTLRPGSYRVAVLGGPSYVPTVTRPLAVRVRAVGP